MIVTPKSEEWIRRYYSTIGGSTAAASVGKSRWTTPRQLWDRMRAVADGQTPEPVKVSDDMRRGILLEPLARQAMAEYLQVNVDDWDQSDMQQNPDYPWAHVTPDGKAGALPIELKCPRPGTITKAILQGLPDEWFIQAQHALAVLQAPAIHVGLFDALTCVLHPFHVQRDQAFIAALMLGEREFYESVHANNPPPAGPTEEMAAAEPGRAILDTPEAATLARAWWSLKDAADDLEEAAELTKAKLCLLSGNAESFEVPGVLRAIHRPQAGSRGIDRAAVEKLYPAVKDDPRCYKTNKPSRPFKTYRLDK